MWKPLTQIKRRKNICRLLIIGKKMTQNHSFLVNKRGKKLMKDEVSFFKKPKLGFENAFRFKKFHNSELFNFDF